MAQVSPDQQTRAPRPTRNPYKPRVIRDDEGWSVLLDNRWQEHPTWQAAVDAALDRCAEFTPGCSRKGCPCRRPGPVCSFRGRLVGGPFCPRCGWSRRLHDGDTRTAADPDPDPNDLYAWTCRDCQRNHPGVRHHCPCRGAVAA